MELRLTVNSVGQALYFMTGLPNGHLMGLLGSTVMHNIITTTTTQAFAVSVGISGEDRQLFE